MATIRIRRLFARRAAGALVSNGPPSMASMRSISVGRLSIQAPALDRPAPAGVGRGAGRGWSRRGAPGGFAVRARIERLPQQRFAALPGKAMRRLDDRAPWPLTLKRSAPTRVARHADQTLPTSHPRAAAKLSAAGASSARPRCAHARFRPLPARKSGSSSRTCNSPPLQRARRAEQADAALADESARGVIAAPPAITPRPSPIMRRGLAFPSPS